MQGEIAVKRSYNNSNFFISEVCSGGELPEVEIISLLEEQIPRYKLRADALTEFTGQYYVFITFQNNLEEYGIR